MSDEIRERIADWLYDFVLTDDLDFLAERVGAALARTAAATWRIARDSARMWNRSVEDDAILAGLAELEHDEATLRDAHQDYKCGGPAECDFCQAELSRAENMERP